MKYLVLECRLSYAVVLDEQGRFIKVANLGYSVGQELDEVIASDDTARPKRSLPGRIVRFAAAAACLCLALLGGWQMSVPAGTVRMQINPEVLMTVNRFRYVLALEGLNEDGEALTAGVRTFGRRLEALSDELADAAVKRGYLSEGGSITLHVNADDDAWGAKTGERLAFELWTHFAGSVEILLAVGEPEETDAPAEETSAEKTSEGETIVIPIQIPEEIVAGETEEQPDDDDDHYVHYPAIGGDDDDDDGNDDDDDDG